MPRPELDHIGELLMREVRDHAIANWEMTLSGNMKDTSSRQIYASLTLDQRELLKQYIPKVVDTTLHYMLCLFEWREDVKLIVEMQDGASNIAEISDGLAGELYTEEGWIARFSQKPWTPP